MSGAATVLLVLALVIVWGGLAVSIVAIGRRPERTDYPAGGVDDDRDDDAPGIRDT
ncbi:methionine/alanine import family NSS transporter small subunit [Puerhibacterium puerhi]|uniref:methionine/alanine import family NSS transporter small subunit n=1 Tax=Puerhibacterium puerhi TaxID=2692623 RepID=UPI0013577E24|nr:methionine/alanine import family NSS transporter small subunit [Puerhibacterium puerhi]